MGHFLRLMGVLVDGELISTEIAPTNASSNRHHLLVGVPGVKTVLDRTAVTVLALVCFLLIANAVVAYLNVRQLNDDAGWVAHTHEVKDNLKEVVARLHVSGGRYTAFMATGDASALSEFRANAETARASLGNIVALTGDNRQQQDSLREVQRRLSELAASCDAAIARRQARGQPSSDEAVVDSQNRKLVGEVDSLLNEMDHRETDLLVDRKRKTERAY